MPGDRTVVALDEVARGNHVCWVVDDPDTYVPGAALLLDAARAAGERPILFGPAATLPPTLVQHAEVMADPAVDVLDAGQFDTDRMVAALTRQTEAARAAGYRGIRIVADMDWLRETTASEADAVRFEALLDRTVGDLDVTIVCAYRTATFGRSEIAWQRVVHATIVDRTGPVPDFQFVAAGPATWRVVGEVDVNGRVPLMAAIAAATSSSDVVIDASGLLFIDVMGMRAIADAAVMTGARIDVINAPRWLVRHWGYCDFASVAPTVSMHEQP